MSLRTRMLALAAAAAAVAGLGITASVTWASTPGCTQGVYAGQCGTQTDAASPAMSWDVRWQGAWPGNHVIGYPDSSWDRATDFFTFTYRPSGATVFEYASNGVASNLCVSEPSQGAGLILAVCSGTLHEQFTRTPVSSGLVTWTDEATGDVVTVNGRGAQLTGDTPGGTPSPSQEFSFSS